MRFNPLQWVVDASREAGIVPPAALVNARLDISLGGYDLDLARWRQLMVPNDGTDIVLVDENDGWEKPTRDLSMFAGLHLQATFSVVKTISVYYIPSELHGPVA